MPPPNGGPELGFGQDRLVDWTAPVTSKVRNLPGGTDFPAGLGVIRRHAHEPDAGFFYLRDSGGLFFDAAAGTTYQLQLGPAPAFWGAVPPPTGPAGVHARAAAAQR